MPIADEPGITPTLFSAPAGQAPKEPELGSVVKSAFRANNDMFAAYELMTKPHFEPDFTFDVIEKLNKSAIPNSMRDDFLEAMSEDEFDFLEQKFIRQQKDLEVVGGAGMSGMVAAIGAGILSPTVLIPAVGPGRTVAAGVKSGAVLGAAGAAVAEGIIAKNTIGDNTEQFMTGVAAGAVLGGIVGGASKYISAKKFAAAEEELANGGAVPYVSQNEIAISGNSSIGAAQVIDDVDPGGVAKIRGGKKGKDGTIDPTKGTGLGPLVKVSPVARLIDQEDFAAYRSAGAALSTGGLETQANVRGQVSTRWGSVEAETKIRNRYEVAQARAVDESYAQYVLGRNAKGVKENIKLSANNYIAPKGKVTKREFRQQIGKAMFDPEGDYLPEAKAAAERFRAEVYEPIKKAYEEVTEKPIGELIGDEAYANRIWNKDAISKNRVQFEEKLTADIERRYLELFRGKAERQAKAQEKAAQAISDFELKPEKATALLSDLRAQRQAVLQAITPDAAAYKAELSKRRKRLRRMKKRYPEDERTKSQEKVLERLQKDFDELNINPPETYVQFRDEYNSLTGRINSLNRNNALLNEKHQRLIARVEQVEDANIARLGRVGRRITKFIDEMDKLSDSEINRQLAAIERNYNTVQAKIASGEKRIERWSKVEDSPGVLKRLDREQRYMKAREKRLDKLAERNREVTNKLENREAIIQKLRDEQRAMLEQVNELNQRQYERTLRLTERAKKLAPEELAKLRERLTAKPDKLFDEYTASLRRYGYETEYSYIGAEGAEDAAQARAVAQENARQITNKLLGHNSSGTVFDVLQGERGAQLARLLDVESKKYFDFLETDAEVMASAYTKQMVPDTALIRKFGDVNGESVHAKAQIELQKKLDFLEYRHKLPKDDPNHLPLKELRKETERLNKAALEAKKTFDALITRVRGTRGLSADPEAMLTRLGQTALTWNAVRLLGGVVISSFADLARPVYKHGFMRTMKDGWLPYIKNLKNGNFTLRELEQLNVISETITQSRAKAMLDTDFASPRGNGFERGLDQVSRLYGVANLLNGWNTVHKQISGMATASRFIDELEVINTGNWKGKPATKAQINKANRYLAARNFNGEAAQRAWAQLQSEGGMTNVNGVNLPNTDLWTDKKVARLFSTSVAEEVDNIIVTPGLERPLMSDANVGAKVLFQFRSFTFSSTSKVTMAGLQQADMAVLNGMMISLALGGLSYYTRAMLAGGDAKKEMLSASPEKWFDEALDYSGFMGVFAEAQKIGERLPGIPSWMVGRLSNERVTRRSASGLTGTLAGPSWGLASSVSQVLTGIDDPTDSTVRNGRMLIPAQNLVYLRWLFDALEDGVAKQTPDKR